MNVGVEYHKLGNLHYHILNQINIKRQFHQSYTKVCILISLFDENFDENKDAKQNDVKVDCI